MIATVLYGINNLFTLETDDGRQIRARIKGKVLKGSSGAYNALAPGDRVSIESDAHDSEKALILGIEARKNLYSRWNEKGRSRQTLAANIDRVILVTSPAFPPFRPRFIDRVQVACAQAGLQLRIVLNKCDLGISEEVQERLDDYSRIGLKPLLCSALSGQGLGELRDMIRGGLSVFSGQSGTGKSSLLNTLQAGLGLKVGELCAKYDRGSHTTMLSALFRLEGDLRGSSVVDTPGFRRFALREIDVDALASLFPELSGLDADCEFGPSCPHVEEEACALLKAVEAGTIHPDRFESYLRIRDELEDSREYEKKASVLAHPRQRFLAKKRTAWEAEQEEED